MFRKKTTRRWVVSALGGSSATSRDVSRVRRNRAAFAGEALELRTLLSAITVNSLADNTTNGDGLVTLREAIIAANTNVATDLGQSGTAGLDTITFAEGLNGSIQLSLGAMTISESLTISGHDAVNTIIDANNASRIFFITGGDTTLAKLTLKNGRTTGDNPDINNSYTFNGGAILSISTGDLTVSQSTLTGNSTHGKYARGGAIYAREGIVTISQSVLSGNSTAGVFAHGGAIHAIPSVSVIDSTFTGNSTTGNYANGGGIDSRQSVSVTRSTVSENFTMGLNSVGGAIKASFGTVTVRESTVSGNSTAGREARGGAIFGGNGLVSVIQSTFSGNSTAGVFGGGGAIEAQKAMTISQSTFSGNFTTGDWGRGGAIILSEGPLLVSQSTITGNSSANSTGGAIYSMSASITIQNSIVAGNTNTTAPDIWQSADSSATLTVRNSLIGSNTGTRLQATNDNSPDAAGNFIGGTSGSAINPLLGPLRDNGGLTFTHALWLGSPAMNRGSNGLAVDVTQVGNPALTTDQRGVGFARILNASVDMGAHEGTGPLSAEIAVTDTSLILGETSLVTITFNETVTGFDNADLSVANGTLTAVSSADGGTTWTAVLTPSAAVASPSNVITIDLTGVMGVAAGVGTDTSNVYAIDTDRPTATIVVANTSLLFGETSLVTIAFSEAVTEFGNEDLTIDNGTLSAVSSANGGIKWTATFTPKTAIADLTNVITLNNAGVTDLAGNAGSGTTISNNYEIDTAQPSATIVVTDESLTSGESTLITITFSKAITGFDNFDLGVSNGTLTAVSSADGGTTWTATLTPTDAITAPTNVITLDLTDVTWMVAATGTISSNNYSIDTLRPTATIVVADESLLAGETSLVTIAFSEAVAGFDNADLTIDNGILSAVSSANGGLTWTATFTPTVAVTDPTNVITLDNAGVTDLAGNAVSGATTSNSFAIYTVVPLSTILVADTSLSIGETALVTITFSESVIGFDNADLTIDNGTLSVVSSADGGTTWTAIFTPTVDIADPANFITLNNAGVKNQTGNSGSGATNSNNYAIDTARPTATIVVADETLLFGETTLVTIVFSEPVKEFDNSDLTIVNGILTAVKSANGGLTWTATFTPAALLTDMTNVLVLDNTRVKDAAGNLGFGTTSSNNFKIDTRVPEAASLIVTTNSDVVDGFDHLTSLREAVALANRETGANTITFATATDSQPFNLSLELGNIEITDTLTINGNGALKTIIDGQQLGFGILWISAGDVTINSMTLRNGKSTSGEGGAIRSNSRGFLTINNSRLYGNSAKESRGGAIYTGLSPLTINSSMLYDNSARSGGAIQANAAVTIVQSTLSNNSAIFNASDVPFGETASGGAISAGSGPVTIILSTLAGNFASATDPNINGQSNSYGGAVWTFGGDVTILKSTLSGNSATATATNRYGQTSSNGGAIMAINGAVTISQSTLSGNSANAVSTNANGRGSNSLGGAVFATEGAVTISQSTLSGNSVSATTHINDIAAGHGTGGGIFNRGGAVTISQSTVTGNSASATVDHANYRGGSSGGGVVASGSAAVTILNSIVAGNSSELRPDLYLRGVLPNPKFTVSNSLIGRSDRTSLIPTSGTAPDDNGNFIGGTTEATKIDPKLGPLADNGGPTKTHALLPGSLAIDRGNNEAAVDVVNGNAVLTTDQRGNGFPRIVEGDHIRSSVVDMGAFEARGVVVELPSLNSSSLRPTLQWTEVGGATAYNVWVDLVSTTTTSQFYRASSITSRSHTVQKDFPIGKYRVWVQPVISASTGLWSAAKEIVNPAAPTGMSMPTSNVVSRPTIAWNSLPGAVTYDVWIDRVLPFKSQLIRQQVTSTSFTPPSDLAMGSYRAWVRAIDAIGTVGVWSSVYNMNVLPPITPTAPLNMTSDTTPTFTWNGVAGAARYEVTIRNATTSAIVHNAVSTTSTSWTPATDLPIGQYQWSVVAVSSAATGSLKSSPVTRSVNIGVPTFIAPVTNSTSSVKTPTFSWTRIAGATSYELWVDRTDVARSKMIYRTGLTSASFTATTPLSAGTYRAWVRAVSSTGAGSVYSAEVSFTITAVTPDKLLPADDLRFTRLLTAELTSASNSDGLRSRVNRPQQLPSTFTDEGPKDTPPDPPQVTNAAIASFPIDGESQDSELDEVMVQFTLLGF